MATGGGRWSAHHEYWNDALIALSARQIGASVVTGNVRDFELLHRFMPFDLEPFE